MTEKREIIVGIAVSPNSQGYFGNGLHQNAFYLYRLFQNMVGVTPLLVFHPLSLKEPPTSIDIFGETAHNLALFVNKYHLDALLLVSVTPPPQDLELFRSKGVKIASITYGNRYISDQEFMVFGHLEGKSRKPRAIDDPLREDLKPDAVWVSPHYTWQRDYIQHRFSSGRSYTCPYIWDSELMDLKFNSHSKYQHHSPNFLSNSPRNKSIFCLEPNISISKTTLFAYQTAARLEKISPGSFVYLRLYNSKDHFDQNGKLANYVARTSDLLSEHRALFLHRASFQDIVEEGSVMFHHHFFNGLNYTLLEGAHLRLPIVHNSEFMPELGYYYPGANITSATKQLGRALLHEERDDLEEYDQTCQDVLLKYSIHNEENIQGYRTLLANLLDKKVSPELPAYINDIEHEVAHGSGYVSPLS